MRQSTDDGDRTYDAMKDEASEARFAVAWHRVGDTAVASVSVRANSTRPWERVGELRMSSAAWFAFQHAIDASVPVVHGSDDQAQRESERKR